jgi:hypothetical protein
MGAYTLRFPLCLVLLAGGTAAAFERTLDLRLVNEAIALGDSRVPVVRARFHQPYRLPVAIAPVDYIEVITPFRRIVQITEERARAGSRTLGQPETIAAAGERYGLLELAVEFTFHPLNSYVGVPAYEVELVQAVPAVRILPRQLARIPRFGARVEGPSPSTRDALPTTPGPTTPMLGGTVIAGFEAESLQPAGVYDVVVTEGEKSLARARLDLGRLR